MDIKLIAIDLDGTTMNSQDVLTKENECAIKTAIENGIYVVPTTGRMLYGIPKEISGINGLKYVICSNGSKVINIEDNCVVYENLLSVSLASDILKELKIHDLYTDLYIDGKAYTEKKYIDNLAFYGALEYRIDFIKSTRTIVDNLEEFLFSVNKKVEKINVTFSNMSLRTAFWNKYSKNNNIYITTSIPNLIEISNKNVNKADGLKALCKKLCINSENVMAIGDSHNDTEMLKFAGVSVAMGNASDEIKKQSKFLTLTNDENGVAHAINKFTINQKRP